MRFQALATRSRLGCPSSWYASAQGTTAKWKRALARPVTEEKTLVKRLPGYTAPAILIGVPFFIWVLTLIDRVRFYDNFVWKYYWGPIVADAENRSVMIFNGVQAQSGYNSVNTISWAILLGVCLFGLAQMLERFNARMDAKLIIGATSWVVAGSIFHVLEDTSLILPPLQYFFITPPIYLLFALFGVLSFLFGQYLKRVEAQTNTNVALRQLWLALTFIVLAYLFAWLQGWEGLRAYIHPIWVALFAAGTFVIVRYRTIATNGIRPDELVLMLSTGWILSGLAYVVEYLQRPWSVTGTPGDGIALAVVYTPFAGLIACGVVYFIAKKLSANREGALAFMLPINLLMVFAQVMDATSTALGVDRTFNPYVEKHVVSGFVIEGFRDAATAIGWEFGAAHPTWLAFLPLKFLIAVLAIYFIDVQGKEDAAKNPVLIGLVKFAIIMVGLGPAIRNSLRLSLGV